MANTELTIVLKAVDQASGSLKKTELSINSLAKSVAGIYLLTKGFEFLQNSINKAAQQEKNLKTLQSVIENQGDSWDRVKGKVDTYIQSLEYNSMFTDQQLIPSMKQLINSGMNTEQAMRALSTATDLATAKGIDLETSANLIGKAYMGNTEALKRYGIQATDFNGVMDEANRKFGGSAKRDMDTYAGSVKRLEATWDGFQKTLGKDVIPTVNKLVLALDTLLGGGAKPVMTANELALATITNRLKELELAGMSATKAYRNLLSAQKDMMLMVGLEQKTKAKEANVPYTPEVSNKVQQEDEKNYIDSLHKQYEATAEIRNATDQLTMSSFDYEMQLIDQKALAYEMLGVQQVDIDNWVIANKIEALNKEFNLRKTTDQIVETMAIGTAEQQKYLIADILEAEMLAQAKKFAWMAVEKLLMLDFAGAAIAGAEAVALGYGASVIHQETERDKALNKEKEDANNVTATNLITDTGNIVTSTGGEITSRPTSIERSASPTYNTFNSQYYIQAGVMLGDESTIDKLFSKLMEKYEYGKKLTTAGA